MKTVRMQVGHNIRIRLISEVKREINLKRKITLPIDDILIRKVM